MFSGSVITLVDSDHLPMSTEVNSARYLSLVHPAKLRICLLMLMLHCTAPQSTDLSDRSDKDYVGELERLGKDAQDILAVGIDADGFDDLSLEQKKLAYFLYRAAIAGNEG